MWARTATRSGDRSIAKKSWASYRAVILCIAILSLLSEAREARSQTAAVSNAVVTHTVDAGGAIRWESRTGSATTRPRFFDVYGSIASLKMPDDPEQLPFGRSIAFLIGVSQYAHLDPLPGVKESIDELRDYLLGDGGFDVVYELSDFDKAPNTNVTPSVVRDYMINRFGKALRRNDRLLFYFAGHGTDRNGATGYLLFRSALPDTYQDTTYLSTSDINEWSKEIPARHILFLLDACSAGFGFDLTSQGSVGVLAALGEGRSREIITAGTGKEETYNVDDTGGPSMTIFGSSLLSALRHSTVQGEFKSLITVDNLFSDLSSKELEFANRKSVPLHPGRYPLLRLGQFVFPNPLARGDPPPAVLIDKFSANLAKSSTEQADLISMLEFRSAAEDHITDDPVLAFSLAANAYRRSPGLRNRRVVLSAISHVQLFYTLQLEGYSVADVQEPFILLTSADALHPGQTIYSVFDTRNSSLQPLTIKADYAWVVRAGASWRIFGKCWDRGINGPVSFKLWDANGNMIGAPVEELGVGTPVIVDQREVMIPLYGENKLMHWDLLTDKRDVVTRPAHDDTTREYFTAIYGALDTRSNGDSAVHYDRGLILMGKDGTYSTDSYTQVDFDPAFSSGRWSSDGRFLALRYAEQQRLGIWDPSGRKFVWLDPNGWVVDSYTWSMEGHILTFSGRHVNATDVTVETVDAADPGGTRKVIFNSDIPMSSMAYVSGDKSLVMSDRSKTLYLLNSESGHVIQRGTQTDIRKLFTFGGHIYTSGQSTFRVWNIDPAPASNWTFQTSSERGYQRHGAADMQFKLLAVPFVDAKSKPGVEIRGVESGERIDVELPDRECFDLSFSEDGKWLVVEMFKHLRIFNTVSWKFQDFSLLQDDKQFFTFYFEAKKFHTRVLGKDSLLEIGSDFDYEIDLSGEAPRFVARTHLTERKDEKPQNRNSDEAGELIQEETNAWDTGGLFSFHNAGYMSAINGSWAIESKCHDESPLSAHCDVMFIPRDTGAVMGMYERILWKPRESDLQKYLTD